MRENLADLAEKSHKVRIVAGELLSQNDLDVIVSFLTEDLSWGGPVNQKLIAHAGHQLDEYVLSNVQRPRAGDAFSAPAFTLPCKQLIFGVITKWDAGLADEDKALKKAVKTIVQLAQTLGFSKIGIPALGQNRTDVPLARSARIIASAIQESDTTGLEEIRLICKTQSAFDVYHERFSPA